LKVRLEKFEKTHTIKLLRYLITFFRLLRQQIFKKSKLICWQTRHFLISFFNEENFEAVLNFNVNKDVHALKEKKKGRTDEMNHNSVLGVTFRFPNNGG